MDKNKPIYPQNWEGQEPRSINWKLSEVQENICPKCHHYGGRFKRDGVCQFCGHKVEVKAEFNIACGMKVIKYDHYGNEVYVLKDKRGQHKDHCLCWICGKFYSEPENMSKNCPIARLLYNICVTLKIVVPVWECPEWIPPQPGQLDEKE